MKEGNKSRRMFFLQMNKWYKIDHLLHFLRRCRYLKTLTTGGYIKRIFELHYFK